MKPANATFQPLATYEGHPPCDLKQAIDFARALEDVAFPVVQPWAVLPLENEDAPPTPDDAQDAPRIAIGENGEPMRAWLCAYLKKPALAALFPTDAWGQWRVQFDSDGLGDVFADGKRVQARLFLHGTADAGPAGNADHLPWVCYSLDTTIQTVALEMARCAFSGLGEANRLVRDVARSIRTAASLLLTDNPRVNRFLSGAVSVNRSTLSPAEREELAKALLDACCVIDLAALQKRERDAFLVSLRACQDALAPLATFAKRFTIFLLGVSHMDLAWKWRWPETVECMQGTLHNQMAFMERYDRFHTRMVALRYWSPPARG